MVKKDNSPNDVQYSMPDASKAFLEAAYVNVAWNTGQSPEILAAAQNLAEQHAIENTITTDDIADVVATVRQNCMAANVPMAEIEKILAHVNSNVGAPKSRLDEVAKAALAEAGTAIATAKGETVQNTMYNEQSLDAQLSKIAQLSEKISHDLYGSMTKEEREQDQKFAEQEKELSRQLAAAKTDAERDAIRKQLATLGSQRLEHYEQTIERLENGTQAEREVARQVKPTVEVLSDALDKTNNAIAEKKISRQAVAISNPEEQPETANQQTTAPTSSIAMFNPAKTGVTNSASVATEDSGILPSQKLPQVASNDKGTPGMTF